MTRFFCMTKNINLKTYRTILLLLLLVVRRVRCPLELKNITKCGTVEHNIIHTNA